MEEVFAILLANPIALKVVIIMQASRLVFKPLCSGIQAYVDASDTPVDNQFWLKIQDNKIFKGLAYVLDYAFSIKIPKV